MLVASDSLPLVDKESGGLRLYTILGQLMAQDRVIVFATFADRKKTCDIAGGNTAYDGYISRLAEIGVEYIIHGSAEINKFVAAQGQYIRDAFLSFPHVGELVLPLLRRWAPNCRIGYDMVDFHSLRIRREAVLFGDLHRHRQADEMERRETWLFKSADIIFAVTEQERQEVVARVEAGNVWVLPNAFRPRSKNMPGINGRAGAVFLGGFWHPPNRDAVVWFSRSVWPTIQSQLPYTELRIGGSNMTDEIRDLQRVDGVKTVGYIKDLDAFYAAARVAIAPLRFGAGMKGKVGEALAYGVPVVTTSIGAEGMNLVHGVNALIADDAEAFANAILRVIRDDEMWERLSTAGLRLVNDTLTPDALGRTLQNAYRW